MRVPLVTDSIAPLYIFYRPFYILFIPIYSYLLLFTPYLPICTHVQKSYRKVSSVGWTKVLKKVTKRPKCPQGSRPLRPPSGQNGQNVDTFDHLVRGWGGRHARRPHAPGARLDSLAALTSAAFMHEGHCQTSPGHCQTSPGHCQTSPRAAFVHEGRPTL